MTRKNLLPWLLAAVIAAFSGTALATPKAAENEEAPVTQGADIARPRLSAKVDKPARAKLAKKTRPAAKSKAHKNVRRKK